MVWIFINPILTFYKATIVPLCYTHYGENNLTLCHTIFVEFICSSVMPTV
jgi:hypothetical protein